MRYIVQSSDGGQTLRLVAQLPGPTGKGVDQPAIDVGPGRSAGETSLWLGFNSEGNYYAVGAAVIGGTVGAFSAPVDVSGGQPASNFGDIAIGPTGQVVVIFQSSTAPGQNTSAIFAATNPGGLGTPAAFSVAAQVTATNVGGWFKIPAQENRSIDAEANLAWDQTAPGTAGHVAPGRVYLTFTDAPSLTSPTPTHCSFTRTTADRPGAVGRASTTTPPGPANSSPGRLSIKRPATWPSGGTTPATPPTTSRPSTSPQ